MQSAIKKGAQRITYGKIFAKFALYYDTSKKNSPLFTKLI
jgi:hypothetical protein